MDSLGGIIFFTTLNKLKEYLVKFYSLFSDSFYNPATVIIILYIVIVGYRVIQGNYGEKTKEVVISLFMVPIMYTIAFDSSLFIEWIYTPINETSLSLTGFFLNDGNRNISISQMFANMDEKFGSIFNAISDAYQKYDGWNVGKRVLIAIVTVILGLIYAFLYLVFVVLLLLGYFAIHVMMVIAVIPIFLAAFKDTRHIFYTWLKASINYALIPVFAAIVMSITMFFLDLAITQISQLDLAKEWPFNQSMALAMLIGAMSIFFHLKAPEFAAAVTGGTPSGMNGFVAAVGASIAGGAMVLSKSGIADPSRSLGTWGAGAGMNALQGLDNKMGGHGGRAYSAMKGFGDAVKNAGNRGN